MAFGKQVTSVYFVFRSSIGGGVATSQTIKIQNMRFEAIHENPLGNPMYTKSMGGTIIPYSLETRYKISLDYDKNTEASTLLTLFNNLITYNVPTKEIDIYPNYVGTSSDNTNYIQVYLDQPMVYAIEYASTIGKFVPTIKLLSRTTSGSIASQWQAPL